MLDRVDRVCTWDAQGGESGAEQGGRVSLTLDDDEVILLRGESAPVWLVRNLT